MKRIFLCAFLSVISANSVASSLQDQLSAVAQAEEQGKKEEKKQYDDWAAERDREIQKEKQRGGSGK